MEGKGTVFYVMCNSGKQIKVVYRFFIKSLNLVFYVKHFRRKPLISFLSKISTPFHSNSWLNFNLFIVIVEVSCSISY